MIRRPTASEPGEHHHVDGLVVAEQLAGIVVTDDEVDDARW